ncbi:hypothetical protein FQZ97_732460 [compost metagenome]
MAKRKTPLGVVDLRRTHAEVHEHTVHAGRPQFAQVRKTLVADVQAHIAGSQRLRSRHGLGILVEDGQPPLTGQLLENQSGVAAASEGGVDVVTVRVDRQCLHGFVQQDGVVNPCALHHHP